MKNKTFFPSFNLTIIFLFLVHEKSMYISCKMISRGAQAERAAFALYHMAAILRHRRMFLPTVYFKG